MITHVRRAFAVVVPPLLAASSVFAGGTFHQAVNHNGSGDWHMPSHWNTSNSSTPSGVTPSSINAADEFIAARKGWILRTGTGVNTFAGGSLTLGGTHMLEVRSASSMSTVPRLIARDTPSVRAAFPISTLTIKDLKIESGELELRCHRSASPEFNLTLGVLTGEGSLKSTGSPGGALVLFLLDATDFKGPITVQSGKVRFMTPVSSGGAFVAPAPGDVTFEHDAAFTDLTVGDMVYPPGTYSAASLGFFGSGNVTVRPPSGPE